MPKDPTNHENELGNYLNDHLAGATLAIELLEHLSVKFPGTEASIVAAAIIVEVVADKDELKSLMLKPAIDSSTTRKAAAWIGEKIVRAKLALDSKSGISATQSSAKTSPLREREHEHEHPRPVRDGRSRLRVSRRGTTWVDLWDLLVALR